MPEYLAANGSATITEGLAWLRLEDERERVQMANAIALALSGPGDGAPTAPDEQAFQNAAGNAAGLPSREG